MRTLFVCNFINTLGWLNYQFIFFYYALYERWKYWIMHVHGCILHRQLFLIFLWTFLSFPWKVLDNWLINSNVIVDVHIKGDAGKEIFVTFVSICQLFINMAIDEVWKRENRRRDEFFLLFSHKVTPERLLNFYSHTYRTPYWNN